MHEPQPQRGLKMKQNRTFYLQILFVALAFAIMTILSYGFMREIVRGNLVQTADGVLDVAEVRTKSRLDGFTSATESFAGEVRGMLMRGAQADMLQKYIDSISQFTFLDGNAFSGIQEFYGYFEELPGGPMMMYSGSRLAPEEEKPKKSDWYRLAVQAGGAVVETVPSIDDGGRVTYKYAKCLLDDDGHCIGVVGMDVVINKIGQEIVSTALNQGGYGMLINQDFAVMFHPNPDFVGIRVDDPAIPIHIFFDELRGGKEIIERPLISYRHEKAVTFFRRLSNGWYLGLVTPERQFYEGMGSMAATLAVLGGLLAAALIGILIRIEKGREKSDRENRQKSQFLANMSHEIRTPLNAVIGLSELALDNEEVGADVEKKLEIIRTSGILILSIVNDILDISKLESGKFEIYASPYDTPSLVNDVVMLNSVRIGERPITLKLDVSENLPSSLCGDDLRVRQIFNNLLSNAFKYTKSGTVEWRVSFERDDSDAGWLVSSVRDTGIGIRPENLQNLFSEYNQIDIKANRNVGGTGLGLSITKHFVEMMGGSITVESEYGKGTTFHVRLRQAITLATPIGRHVADSLMGMRYTLAKRNKNKKRDTAKLPSASVLVVDDITTNLDVARGLLKPYGLRVDCATSGSQAVAMIRAGKRLYDAIFMDHMMPEMDGIEAARIIREEIGTEYARNIPIIALTANAIVGSEEMFLNKGFQDFISKPIDTAKLDAVLRRWIRNKSRENNMTSIKNRFAEQNRSDCDYPGDNTMTKSENI